MEYDPLGNSNLSFHFGANILDFLFLFDFLNIFPCVVYAKI